MDFIIPGSGGRVAVNELSLGFPPELDQLPEYISTSQLTKDYFSLTKILLVILTALSQAPRGMGAM